MIGRLGCNLKEPLLVKIRYCILLHLFITEAEKQVDHRYRDSSDLPMLRGDLLSVAVNCCHSRGTQGSAIAIYIFWSLHSRHSWNVLSGPCESLVVGMFFAFDTAMVRVLG